MITANWMTEPGQQDQLNRIRERSVRWGHATKDGSASREQRIGDKVIRHTKGKK